MRPCGRCGRKVLGGLPTYMGGSEEFLRQRIEFKVRVGGALTYVCLVVQTNKTPLSLVGDLYNCYCMDCEALLNACVFHLSTS